MYGQVTPLLREIIHLDEVRFGRRREAIFNSLHAMTVNCTQIMFILIATATMDLPGNSLENRTGVLPVESAGDTICLIGLVSARFYPAITPIKPTTNVDENC